MSSIEKIFEKINEQIHENAEKIMKKSLSELKEKIVEYTPEDTDTLTKNTKILPIRHEGTRIIGRIENNTDYVRYVEFGRRNKPSRYYKKGGRKRGATPFYVGYGARMFTRTIDEKKDEIIANFSEIGKVNISGNFNS